MQKLKLFLLLNILSLFICFNASAKSTQVNIILNDSMHWNFNSIQEVISLENLAKKNPEHIKILGSVIKLGYTDKREYIIPKPTENTINHFYTRIPDLLKESDKFPPQVIKGMASDYAYMYQYPDTRFNLMERLYKELKNNPVYGDIKLFYPDLKESVFSLTVFEKDKNKFFRLYANNEYTKNPTWRSCFFLIYQLEIDGEKTEVYFIIKNYGGSAKSKTGLENILKEQGKENSLVLGLGDVNLTDKNTGIKFIEEAGFNAFVPSSSDFSLGAKYLKDYDAGHNLSILAANIVTDKDEQYFRPYLIKNINGMKIGIIGMVNENLAKNIFIDNFTGLQVKDSVPCVKNVMNELREQVDLVVLLSKLSPEENSKIIRSIRGIDILAYEDQAGAAFFNKTEEINIQSHNSKRRDFPYLKAEVPLVGFSVINVFWDGYGELNKIAQKWIKLDESIDTNEENIQKELEDIDTEHKQQIILPDIKKLGKNAIAYSDSDFYLLMNEILLKSTDSEIAFNRIYPFGASLVGDIWEFMLQARLMIEDNIVVCEMTGQQLTSVMNKYKEFKKDKNINLSFKGITEDLIINGRPVNPKQTYKVVTTNFLCDSSIDYPIFKQSKIKRKFTEELPYLIENEEGKHIKYRDWILSFLKYYRSKLNDIEYIALIKEGISDKNVLNGLLSINFDNLKLNLSNTSLYANDKYSEVLNSRINTNNQFVFGGSGNLNIDYDNQDISWANKLSMKFNQTTIQMADGKSVTNDPYDDILSETELTWKPLHLNLPTWNKEILPSIALAYNTEFTPITPDGARKSLLRVLLPAFNLSSASDLQKFRLASIIESNFRPDGPNVQYGLMGDIIYSMFLPNDVTWKNDFSCKYLFPAPNDTNADLSLEMQLNTSFSFPVTESLSISPYIDAYMFKGKMGQDLGLNLSTGLSFGFSKFWKPQYNTLF